jgi:hypothetical protein
MPDDGSERLHGTQLFGQTDAERRQPGSEIGTGSENLGSAED